LRAFTKQKNDPERAKQRYRREASLLRKLRHPNIARFYGVSFQFAGQPALVMQWYNRGTAIDYLTRERQLDSKKLEMVAQGLRYLHSMDVVHGDLKGSNILITDDEHAVLSDFGLAGFAQDFAEYYNNTTYMSSTIRWASFELLTDELCDDNENIKTTASDVWAFACTAFELMNNRLPYHWLAHDFSVIQAIYKGTKPVHLKKDVWNEQRVALYEKLEKCWSPLASERPTMEQFCASTDWFLKCRL
ncbi:hypothetical protein AMATHDRAFT_149833, partial [Amanita thiersii Skay4041]